MRGVVIAVSYSGVIFFGKIMVFGCLLLGVSFMVDIEGGLYLIFKGAWVVCFCLLSDGVHTLWGCTSIEIDCFSNYHLMNKLFAIEKKIAMR